MNNDVTRQSYFESIVIVAMFIIISYGVQTHVDFFVEVIGDQFTGKLLYVLITIIATVVAPVSSMPLIAVASSLWGFVTGALLSIVGWFVGATIAFELSRSFGKRILFRLISMRSQERLQRIIPQDYTIMSLVLLRMSVPVDVLSYALGLFSAVSRKKYYLSTALGIIPFAFAFAYFGRVDYRLQIAIFSVAGLMVWRYQRIQKPRDS